MLCFDAVSYIERKGRRCRGILKDVSLRLGPHDRVAVLGDGRSGKSTLIRLASGALAPTSGCVRRLCPISPPLGASGQFHTSLSGAANVTLLARLADVPAGPVRAFCREVADLGARFDAPMSGYTNGMRARLGFALSYAMPSQILLADEMVGTGDTAHRALCDALLDRALETSGLLLVTRNARLVDRFGCRPFALVRGHLLPCRSSAEAERLVAAARVEPHNQTEAAA
ncbi:ATP-binding cassette domain-containing protein [Oceanomicrobium pacificus]|uniref:ATP-binding cassette domain-containing protein n=1 Tax=Oceanomicrobium pacificus TaxID=2692916 RepID=A0A6B0TPX6_9RHOB|nr:ATP-binding cassette domain-containing protein [Oceanomicrobium pacificus]MXU65986.1 ATP-binding cassette domain-containing protein [Oceanomicrobium pacificus]